VIKTLIKPRDSQLATNFLKCKVMKFSVKFIDDKNENSFSRKDKQNNLEISGSNY